MNNLKYQYSLDPNLLMINNRNRLFTDPNLIVNNFSNSNNNLNPFLHSIYLNVRKKIKNNKEIYDYKSVLDCIPTSEIQQIPNPLTTNPLITNPLTTNSLTTNPLTTNPLTTNPLTKNSKNQKSTNLKSGEIDLFDTKSFSPNSTYLIDSSNWFNKNDFLSALRNMNKNPILFFNSERYKPKPEDNNLIIDDDDDNDCNSSDSTLKFIDRTNLIPLLNSIDFSKIL